MKPIVLLPEETIRGNGNGPDMALSAARGNPLHLVLVITRMMEQQTLEIRVWGSVDGIEWGHQPLLVMPRRYYCGTYQQVLDLTTQPHISYLRVDWVLRSWNPTTTTRLATFSMTADKVAERVHAMAMA